MLINESGILDVAWKSVVVDDSIIIEEGGSNRGDSACPVGVTAVVFRVVVVVNLVTFKHAFECIGFVPKELGFLQKDNVV